MCPVEEPRPETRSVAHAVNSRGAVLHVHAEVFAVVEAGRGPGHAIGAVRHELLKRRNEQRLVVHHEFSGQLELGIGGAGREATKLISDLQTRAPPCQSTADTVNWAQHWSQLFLEGES